MIKYPVTPALASPAKRNCLDLQLLVSVSRIKKDILLYNIIPKYSQGILGLDALGGCVFQSKVRYCNVTRFLILSNSLHLIGHPFHRHCCASYFLFALLSNHHLMPDKGFDVKVCYQRRFEIGRIDLTKRHSSDTEYTPVGASPCKSGKLWAFYNNSSTSRRLLEDYY